MANVHYGNIGDIWKHLPLAEILAIERPRQYWESHAGSAQYPLTPSLGRDYGALHFLKHAADTPILCASAYWRVLGSLKYEDGHLRVYPGSPLIAMTLLATTTQYLFCDIDGASLRTIWESTQELGIPQARLECVQDDGVEALWQVASRLSRQEAFETFVHIDPYRPFEANPAGLTPLDLFGDLSRRGARTMLWYGYDSPATRAVCWKKIRSALAAYQLAAGTSWCGEINLAALHAPGLTINPGVRGCGILLSNLSEQALSACTRLGEALAEIYRTATFRDGQSGAIDFAVISL
jgi:23S rRNA A2030 N6-methylase RlmJ